LTSSSIPGRDGYQYWHIRRIDKAEQAIRKALAGNPDRPNTWVLLGLVQAKQGRLAQAVVSCEKASALDPQDGRVWDILAQVYHKTGDQKKSRKARKMALRLKLAKAKETYRHTLLSDPHFDETGLDPADIDALLANGAGVNTKDRTGRTPLHWAAVKGNKEVAEFLIAKGANLEAIDRTGRTPLHQAALEGHDGVAILLINKGANVHARDPMGGTPLHCAAISAVDIILLALIAKKADVNAKDSEGKTPIDWAWKEDTKTFLRKYGGKSGQEIK